MLNVTTVLPALQPRRAARIEREQVGVVYLNSVEAAAAVSPSSGSVAGGSAEGTRAHQYEVVVVLRRQADRNVAAAVASRRVDVCLNRTLLTAAERHHLGETTRRLLSAHAHRVDGQAHRAPLLRQVGRDDAACVGRNVNRV